MDKLLHQKIDEINEKLDIIINVMKVNPEYSKFVNEGQMLTEIERFKKKAHNENMKMKRERVGIGIQTLIDLRANFMYSQEFIYRELNEITRNLNIGYPGSIQQAEDFLNKVLEKSNFQWFEHEFNSRLKKRDIQMIDIETGIQKIKEKYTEK